MRALVVDDSRAIRDLLSDALAGAGFEIAQAGDGRQALALLDAEPGIELVLVDWNMPNMDGMEFVEVLRQDERFTDTRVMMVTMERSASHIARAARAGVDQYLTKPCTKAAILDRVRAMGFSV